MIVIILDWSGTIFIIIGSIIFTSKRAFKPEVRLFALIFYLLSNIFWNPFAILLETYGLLITQIILFFINARGIILCIIDIRKVEIKVLEELEELRYTLSPDTIVINGKITMNKEQFKDVERLVKIIKW